MKNVKAIPAGTEILGNVNGEELLRSIELAGRTCYKSEEKITKTSYLRFVRMLIEREHEAMLEHANITVRFVCDRGVTHEIVRHRIASYAQESTRYCNYSEKKFGKEVTFIRPFFFEGERLLAWEKAMEFSEKQYLDLITMGASPQEARSVLPNSTKTEIVVTMNLREWRHFFKLRTAPSAHPQMREVTIPLLEKMKSLVPVVFDDIMAVM